MTTPSQVLTTGDPGHAVREHSPIAAFAHDTRGGISNPILGMLLFICSEVMFFSGLFAAYFNVRATTTPWPPVVANDPVLTEHFNLHAEPFYALGLTIILVLSSFTCQFAVWSIRRGSRPAPISTSPAMSPSSQISSANIPAIPPAMPATAASR